MVDSVAQLDLSALYAKSGPRGGEPYAHEVLLGLLLYGYATGVFSSRKIERATYEAVPFRFIAGNLHPDHDTLAVFRRTFLPELKELFVQVLLLAQEAGVLKLGTISLDGTKVHADASKRKTAHFLPSLALIPLHPHQCSVWRQPSQEGELRRVDEFVEPTPVGYGQWPPHPSSVQTASIHQPDALRKNQVGQWYLSCLPLQDRSSFRGA